MTENQHPTQTVTQTNNQQQANLFSLVLSAARINHTVQKIDSANWEIHVNHQDYPKADYELGVFIEENRNWPPSQPAQDQFAPIFQAHTLLLIGIMVLFFSVTGSWSPLSEWFQQGAVNSSQILNDGEYYRLVTALTLHSDIVHLLSNCFLGAFLLHFYFRILGNGIGLAALLVAATSANMLNVIGHGPGHLSVGFSTAVFSVIGILSAINFRHYKLKRPARLLLPLMAGAALLAMLGSSGERTDLGAHFYGLATGLITGLFLSFETVLRQREKFKLQLILALSSWFIVLMAWYYAIN
ncbi:rhomboid family intramembrane serine protease [Desulfosediminicola ganghwensis]|uniref:rhomboid family intramembrane serine protease n=1 Tax=Desulfosediminicola ganghwensis TaxID=2569540 RepID=UPI0010AD7550|nr:rhomboid family intramembrane serine protease [Desulfosediminicola ganghwensis]